MNQIIVNEPINNNSVGPYGFGSVPINGILDCPYGFTGKLPNTILGFFAGFNLKYSITKNLNDYDLSLKIIIPENQVNLFPRECERTETPSDSDFSPNWKGLKEYDQTTIQDTNLNIKPNFLKLNYNLDKISNLGNSFNKYVIILRPKNKNIIFQLFVIYYNQTIYLFDIQISILSLDKVVSKDTNLIKNGIYQADNFKTLRNIILSKAIYNIDYIPPIKFKLYNILFENLNLSQVKPLLNEKNTIILNPKNNISKTLIWFSDSQISVLNKSISKNEFISVSDSPIKIELPIIYKMN